MKARLITACGCTQELEDRYLGLKIVLPLAFPTHLVDPCKPQFEIVTRCFVYQRVVKESDGTEVAEYKEVR